MAPRTDSLEREVKLGVWPGFRLPGLEGVLDGVTSGEARERRLTAIYYDTADARLSRAGISLRHRSGDGSGWTLKLPDVTADGDGTLLRRELTFPGTRRTVPASVTSLLTAWVRSSSLGPVAHLRTTRQSLDVLGPDGSPWAEVVDDDVSVLEGRRVTLHFREVEVEVGVDAPPALLDELVARLRAAGAGPPDPTTKVQRALGPVAVGPGDLEPFELDAGASAADAIRAAFTASVLRLVEHDIGVRLGDDPEAVHQARVAMRRLRSDLRTYGSLLEEAWAESLRDELSAVAAALGDVRDTDVLLERLRNEATGLGDEDASAVATLLGRLEDERAAARKRLLKVLEGDGYVALLDRLVEAARAPLVTQEAAQPALEALPGLAAGPWRKLRKAVRALGRDPVDEQLHEVRIRAKRARYAADVAALVVGKPASRFSKAVAGVQEALGDLQDAVVSEHWLRGAAAGAGPEVALVAGQLIAAERNAADVARQGWKKAWKAADRSSLRSWLGH